MSHDQSHGGSFKSSQYQYFMNNYKNSKIEEQNNGRSAQQPKERSGNTPVVQANSVTRITTIQPSRRLFVMGSLARRVVKLSKPYPGLRTKLQLLRKNR